MSYGFRYLHETAKIVEKTIQRKEYLLEIQKTQKVVMMKFYFSHINKDGRK